MSAVRSGSIYFLIVFAAGFVLGTVRTLFVAPAVGEIRAIAAELPLMLIVSWWACGFVLRRWPVDRAVAQRLLMGAVAFVLLMAGEVLVSMVLAGLTFGQHLELYESLPAQLGLAGQIPFAVFPLLRLR